MKTIPRYSTKYGEPNAINTKANHLGAFFCEEVVEAARELGLLISAFPAQFTPNQESRYRCSLTGKQEGLMIAEIRYGTDQNTMRNIVAKMFSMYPQSLATPQSC